MCHKLFRELLPIHYQPLTPLQGAGVGLYWSQSQLSTDEGGVQPEQFASLVKFTRINYSDTTIHLRSPLKCVRTPMITGAIERREALTSHRQQ